MRSHTKWKGHLWVLLAAVLASRAGRSDQGSPGLDPNDIILVPIRWCALEGTLAVDNPGASGETNTDDVLWRRHERATDNIFVPGAGISFRSAFTAAVKLNANFPVIKDPHPPNMGGPGVNGDVLDALIDDTEIKEAHADCLKEWDKLENMLQTNLEGPIALNIRGWVDQNGNFTNLLGIGYHGVVYASGNNIADACADPVNNIVANDGDMAFTGVVQFTSVSIDPHDKLLAHEMGHVLFLGHGNGLDDNNDGLFDTFCDGSESLQTPASLMSASSQGNELITPLQRAMLRTVAVATTGATIDPPAVLLDIDVLRDSRVDEIYDAELPSFDILTAGIAVSESPPATVVSHTLFGRIPVEHSYRYVLFADLDDDPSTGGEPRSLGFPTDFRGVELVTQVLLEPVSGPGVPPFFRVEPTVWKWDEDSAAFRQVADDRIGADLAVAVESETGVKSFDRVAIRVPNEIAGVMGQKVIIQAIAELLELEPGLIDYLPDSREEGLPLFLEFPRYPLASVAPLQARRGDPVRVEAMGLIEGGMAKVFLGDVMVGGGPIGDEGEVTLEFTIPEDTPGGPRLVTVGVQGTALTADTFVEVLVDGEGGGQRPGDCNQDGSVDISDALCVFGVLFLGNPPRFPCGRGSPADRAAIELLDWQGDGGIDVSDGIAALQFLFVGGPPHLRGGRCVEIDGCPDNRLCR